MSWIMIAGPYASGGADAAQLHENLAAMNRAALAVFEKGHTPVIGVNMALPVIDAAGADRFDEIMTPISLSLADRCDAILRIGGPSTGADQEVERMKAAGRAVYFCLEDVPEARRSP